MRANPRIPAAFGCDRRLLTDRMSMAHPLKTQPMPCRDGAGRGTLALLLLSGLLSSACRDDAPVKVDALKFEGVHAVREPALRAVLTTKAGSWIPFSKKPAFNTDEFQQDLQRLRSFYAERGYPDARVTDIDVAYDRKKEHVRLTVTVREGEPVRVSAVRFEGFDAAFDSDRPRKTLRSLVPIEVGAVRDRQQVGAAREATLNLLKEEGYPYARVDVREEPGEAAKRVTIVLHAVPGRRATFGPIEIRGNASVGENVVRRQLALQARRSLPREPGAEQPAPALVARSLQLRVRRAARRRTRSRRRCRCAITVAEDKHRQFTARGRLRHRGEGARPRRLEARQLLRRRADGGRREQVVVARSRRPPELQRALLLHPAPVVLGAGAGVERARAGLSRHHVRRARPASRGGAIAAIRRPRAARPPRWACRSSTSSPTTASRTKRSPIRRFRNELIALGLDPETGAAKGTVVALRLQADHDTTLEPPRSAAWLRRRRRARARRRIPARHLHLHGIERRRRATTSPPCARPWRRRFVAASSSRSASAWRRSTRRRRPTPSVPFFKRYFLGGSTSLRGWGRYEVSPLTESGQPIGGLTLLEGSSEVRVPVGDKLSVVGFVDAGSVGRRPWRIDPRRPARRRRTGPALRHADRAGAARSRLSAEPDSRTCW